MTPTIDQSVDPSNPATKLPGKPHRQDDVNIIIRDLQARLARLENFIGQAPVTGVGLIHSGDAAGGDLTLTYPNPSLANNSTARGHLGLGSAAVQPDTAFVLASSPQPKVGRPYGVYRSGAAYGLAAGWQNIIWDTYDLDGSNAEGLWTPGWTANATGLWFLIVTAYFQNAQGGTIDVALGYNSLVCERAQVANTAFYAMNFAKVLYLGSGSLIDPTIYVNVVGGFGVNLQAGSYTSFQRVG